MDNVMSGNQDDCLITLSKGYQLPATALRQLPPWRAVLIARIGNQVGVGISDGTTLEELIQEARDVGGEGQLRR